MSSSNASLNCRIEWRPSRLHGLALVLLGLLAAAAVALGAVPWPLVVPSMMMAAAWGLGLAAREMRRPAIELSLRPDGRRVLLAVDGQPVRLLALNLRGPLAVLVVAGAAGRRRYTWWPDTLTPDNRRILRLLKQAGPDSPSVLPLVAG